MVFGNGRAFYEVWHTDFKPKEESPLSALVWVCLPNLHRELWNEDVFEDMGKALGGFMGFSKRTWDLESLTYA